MIRVGGGKDLSSDPASVTSVWSCTSGPLLSASVFHIYSIGLKSPTSQDDGRFSGPGPIYPCLSQDSVESQTLKVRKILRDPLMSHMSQENAVLMNGS